MWSFWVLSCRTIIIFPRIYICKINFQETHNLHFNNDEHKFWVGALWFKLIIVVNWIELRVYIALECNTLKGNRLFWLHSLANDLLLTVLVRKWITFIWAMSISNLKKKELIQFNFITKPHGFVLDVFIRSIYSVICISVFDGRRPEQRISFPNFKIIKTFIITKHI